MTSNTSPKKPDWFALIEKEAPSAQVRKVDKKLPAATAFVALAIVAMGTFFANGSMKIDSSAATQAPAKGAQAVNTVKNVKVAAPATINRIADPTLNGGGDDDDEDDDDDDEDDEDDEDDRD